MTEVVVVVTGIAATCVVVAVALLIVRGRWPARRAAVAVFAVAVVAWFPIPDHWNDGCNRHDGWVPLWMVPVASPLQKAGISPSATSEQTMVLCGDAG